MIKKLMVAAVLLAPTAQAAPNHLEAPKTPVRAVSEPHKASQGATQPTPEQYFVPWENWLKKQGSPISGRDVWEAQQETGIQGEVLICITGAETNYGKVAQRGSKTNVGSVGSYDATNTTHSAGSIKDGLVMIGRTLNNKLLGHKTTIAQLSRASEPYGAVYAESTYNWRVNLLSCLKKIKGVPVNDQYTFRTQ